jgi:hypothetical protein
MTQLAQPTPEFAPDARTGEPGFTDDSVVEVRQVGEEDWETLSPLKYWTGRTLLPVTSPQCTDFASVPRAFVWLIPRYGLYTRAAILHDQMCRTGSPPRHEADRIFRQAMCAEDVAFLRRWMMWAAVRIGALKSPHEWRGWLRHSWQVLLLLPIALVVIGPPAVLIVIGLGLFFLFEKVAQGILALVHRARRKPGERKKRVNTPRLSLKL